MQGKPFSGGFFSRTLEFRYRGKIRRWGRAVCICWPRGVLWMRETELGGWEVGLGGKELSPIQQRRAVVGFPKIEKEGGEIGAAREVGVARETLAPRQPFWGLGKGWGRPKP